MKLTYQKDGASPKLSLKKIQRVNLFFWRATKILLILFLVLAGSFFLMKQKKPLNFSSLPELNDEAKEHYTHAKLATSLIDTHKAPSISFALISGFILHKDSITGVVYRDTGSEIYLTFLFENLSPEQLDRELKNLEKTEFFKNLRKETEGSEQRIITEAKPELFEYFNTLPEEVRNNYPEL